MSCVSFDTKFFVFVLKGGGPANFRGMYSSGNDSSDPTSAQLLFRDGNQFSKDQQLRFDGNTDTQQFKGVAFPTDGARLASSWDEACASQFGFAAAQANSVSLAVNLGINSSLWMLGRRDYTTSENVSPSVWMIREYIRKLFDSLTRTNNDSNFKRKGFSVPIKCYEVFGDQIRDLVALSNVSDITQSNKDIQVRVREHPTRGAFVAGLVQKTASSAPEAVQIVHEAYEQRLVMLSAESSDKSNVSIKQSAGPKQHHVIGTVGNVVLVIEVEQELVSNAHTSNNEETVVHRSATIQCNFLCEMDPLYKPSKNETISTLPLAEVNKNLSAPSTTVEVSQTESIVVLLPSGVVTTPVQVSQLAVCAKSMASLSRVVTLLQQNAALAVGSSNSTDAVETASVVHVPYRESTLTRVLQPMLEGKYVNCIHCCLDERAEQAGTSLATAAYSLRLATELRAGVRSHVVPNERFTRRSAPAAATVSPNSHQQVSATAEVAKDITAHSSLLAIEEILRVTERSRAATLTGPVQQQDVNLVNETIVNNAPGQDEEQRNAFWDLLLAMNADGGVDYFALERLQKERARLLASLEGMVERADDTVASRRLLIEMEGIDAQQDRHEGSFGPSKDIANVANVANVAHSLAVITPPAEDCTSFPTTPPEATLQDKFSLVLARLGSPQSEKPSPLLGLFPTSSSAGLFSEMSTPMLSPLPSLSQLPSPLEAAESPPIARRTLRDMRGLSSSVASTQHGLSARDGAPQRESNSAKEVFGGIRIKGDGGVTASSAKLSRTVRSQSVKGSSPVAALSPVQAPLRRSHTGRAVVTAKTNTVASSSTVESVSISLGATSLLKSGGASSTSKAIAATMSSKRASSRASTSSLSAPVPQLGPVLVAGKVATNAIGLKTFVPLVAQDNFSMEAEFIAADVSLKDALRHSQSHSPERNPSQLMSSHRNDLSEASSSALDDGIEITVNETESTLSNMTPLNGASGDKTGTPSRGVERIPGKADPITPRTLPQRSNSLSPALAPIESSKTAQLSAPVSRLLSSTSESTAPRMEPNTEPNPQPTTPPTVNYSVAAIATTPPLSSSKISSASLSPIRRLLPSERADPSPAHEDAQGSHLSELEVRFLRAVSHSVFSEVAQCIRLGVNIKVKNSFGRDAMQIAARNGFPPLLSLIHEHGGEISTRGPKGDTLYHLAASNGHVSVLAWLTEHVYRGAGLAGDAVDIYGQTAAHVAARRGETGVLRYLHHTLGVDVLQEDFDGRTPLETMPKLFLSGIAEGLQEAKEFLTSLIDLK